MQESQPRHTNNQPQQPSIPIDLICPLTKKIMENPVVIDTGRTFKRSALRNFWEDGRFVDPVTDEDLISSFYYSNLTVKSIIRKYQKGELMPNVQPKQIPDELEALERRMNKVLREIEEITKRNIGQLKNQVAMMFRKVNMAMVYTKKFEELSNPNKDKFKREIQKLILGLVCQVTTLCLIDMPQHKEPVIEIRGNELDLRECGLKGTELTGYLDLSDNSRHLIW